ncbi:MAG: hypothetical protein AVO33_01085 [delta proteobacterium ML8_F1]|nr:MAG: hypothetical protein AVO33_01085 [delta proteobacterium ML8_F1]
MNKDNSYDYEYDDRYCYKQSNVLINKLDIKDSYELSVAEREITALRMMDAKINKIEGHFDFEHLYTIHRYLFCDIYDWAGKLRWVNIAKGNGRTQRLFIEYLAESIGYRVDFSDVSESEMIEASATSF